MPDLPAEAQKEIDSAPVDTDPLPDVDQSELAGEAENQQSFSDAVGPMFGTEEEAAETAEAEESGEETDTTTEITDEGAEEELEEGQEAAEDEVEGEDIEGEEELEEADEGPQIPQEMMDEIRTRLPDVAINDEDDLLDTVEQMYEARQNLQFFDQLVSQDPNLQNYIQQVVDGTDPRMAAVEAFGDLTEAPDPEEDPEAYAEWRENRARQQERQKMETEEEKQQRKRMEAVRESAQKQFETFAQQVREQDEDFDPDQFRRTMLSIMMGDPESGRYPRQAFRVVYRGMKFEDAVEQAREEAYRKGRNDAFEEVDEQSKRGAAATPNLNATSSRTTSEESTTTGDEEGEELARQLAGSGEALEALDDMFS